MRRSLHWMTALGLPLMLAACGGGEEGAELGADAEVIGGDTTAAGMAPAPMDTGMAGMAGAGSTVTLQPLNNSGVSGEATISEQGGGTQVMVRLTGSQPSTTHPGHIHQGTCDNLGPVVAPLEPVTTGADGAGTSTSTVNQPMMTVMNGQHVVNYHAPDGQPISCGQIQAHQM